MSVPTTLSAGEFAPYAGCTDPTSKVKETYVSRLQLGQLGNGLLNSDVG